MDYDAEISLDDLRDLNSDYKSVPFVESNHPPDGKYNACISSVKLKKSEAGSMFILWDLVISDGKHKGRKLTKRSYLTPDSMPYTKTDLKICGVVLDDLEHLPERKAELIGVELQVFKKERSEGEGYNLYFNKKI